MSYQPPPDWGPPWSSPQPPPLWGMCASGGPVAPMGGQVQAYAHYPGSEYQPMESTGSQFYPAGPEAQINDPCNYDVVMDIDSPDDLMDVDTTAESSYAPFPVYMDEPRTPTRRRHSRATSVASSISRYLSPVLSPMKSRSRTQSAMKASTNSLRPTPSTPYTLQRTPRKPTLAHHNPLPALFGGSTYYPPITPRRKKSERYARLYAHEVNELTDRLADLTITSADADADVAKPAGPIFDGASMLSDVGSEATLVPVRGCGNANDMKNLGAKMELGQHFEWNEAVEEFLQSVLAIVPHQ